MKSFFLTPVCLRAFWALLSGLSFIICPCGMLCSPAAPQNERKTPKYRDSKPPLNGKLISLAFVNKCQLTASNQQQLTRLFSCCLVWKEHKQKQKKGGEMNNEKPRRHWGFLTSVRTQQSGWKQLEEKRLSHESRCRSRAVCSQVQPVMVDGKKEKLTEVFSSCLVCGWCKDDYRIFVFALQQYWKAVI